MPFTATHTLIFSDDADQTRAFFRDVLGFPFVDAHGGWLIFKLPPAELGIHPTEVANPTPDPRRGPDSSAPAPAIPARHHEISLMCDDINETVAELTSRGVEFTSPITDRGFGLVTSMKIPGGGELGLYQPKHLTAYDIP
jgi:catechol 2,3-dioxygenase-like lactoylglutathione lyase family enzyme